MPQVTLWTFLRRHAALCGLVLAGVGLRVLYLLSTPYNIRAYDVDAHVDYIKYVVAHFSIPPVTAGWEMHQAPLYYFLCALWVKAGLLLGITTSILSRNLQFGSMLLAVCTLLAGVAAAFIAFPEKNDTRRLIVVAILAVFPGLIFFSSRISNDTLFTFFSFAFFALLLRWWKSGKNRDWYWLCLSMGLAMLTKLNGALLLPIAYGCLLLKRPLSFGEKIRIGAVGGGIALACVGWFLLLRAGENYYSLLLLPGSEGLNGKLLIPTRPSYFLQFNPLNMLLIPYNTTWSDVAGRRSFWEFFFRSAFFGEWPMPDSMLVLARSVIFFALGELFFVIWGFWKHVWSKDALKIPVALTAAVLLAALVIYRVLHNCACNQDFRFIPLIAAPAVYYVAYCIGGWRGTLRTVALAWTLVFVTVCAWFILSLSL